MTRGAQASVTCTFTPNAERLGHYVVSRRVALGFRSRTDLADSLQFTVRTLAYIEHGVRQPHWMSGRSD